MPESSPWNDTDLREFARRGMNVEEADRQLRLLQAGMVATPVQAPCTPGNGIRLLDDSHIRAFKDRFEAHAAEMRIEKFVPASGAASRMFRHLFDPDAAPEKYQEFFSRISEFPFYHMLAEALASGGEDLNELLERGDHAKIIEVLLGEGGLSFARTPKGVIPFHSYGSEVRNAFEEHLVEMRAYDDGSNKLSVHFTVNSQALEDYRSDIMALAERLGIEVSFSEQFPVTDTLALNENGMVARDDAGELVFRPGGHGSLIYNLADREADIIFIKNIDNVVPDQRKETTVNWKRVLGGLLIELTEARDRVLSDLLKGASPQPTDLAFLQDMFLAHGDIWPTDRTQLISHLDRPMRVAGMVQNEGEPGGGPFWVQTETGSAMQIIEASQIDQTDPEQAAIMASATHFNPVDIACSIRRFDGTRYDLHQFVDRSQAFIAEKSVQGKRLRALEHPGLWNGAMAGWLTTFVEVPLDTFAPVKTVNDLLRKAHRSE